MGFARVAIVLLVLGLMSPAISQSCVAVDLKQRLSNGDDAALLGSGIWVNDGVLVSGGCGYDQYNGRGYIFEEENGQWVQKRKTNPGTDEKEYFSFMQPAVYGREVAFNAIWHTVREVPKAGAVFVYHDVSDDMSGTWRLKQKIKPPQLITGQRFGISMVMDSKYLIIAADYGGDVGQGVVHIYTKTGANLRWKVKKSLSIGEPGDQFGEEVLLSGRELLVAAVSAEAYGVPNAGACYYYRLRRGVWTFEQKILPDFPVERMGFATGMAMVDKTIVLGANRGNNDKGTAFVYQRGTDGFELVTELKAPDGGRSDRFGGRVALNPDANMIVIGAEKHDVTGDDSGAAYVFAKCSATDGEWVFQMKISPDDAEAGDKFGVTPFLTADSIFIGSPKADTIGATQEDTSVDAGAIYIYNYIVSE